MRGACRLGRSAAFLVVAACACSSATEHRHAEAGAVAGGQPGARGRSRSIGDRGAQSGTGGRSLRKVHASDTLGSAGIAQIAV